jgi:aspartokinase-like uncharacterized kinase
MGDWTAVTPTCLAVIKVGGSLFDWPELPDRLEDFIKSQFPKNGVERHLLIAGGGQPADVVREFDRIHRLGDVTAHRLALDAMELSARLLSAVVRGADLIESLQSVNAVLASGRLPVLAPSRTIRAIELVDDDPLPASWAVTSDSIAARIAAHARASRLILLKSTSIRPDSARQEAARAGLVDPYFPEAARAVRRVECLNLRDGTARLESLIP